MKVLDSVRTCARDRGKLQKGVCKGGRGSKDRKEGKALKTQEEAAQWFILRAETISGTGLLPIGHQYHIGPLLGGGRLSMGENQKNRTR